jgi:hypothetical protein
LKKRRCLEIRSIRDIGPSLSEKGWGMRLICGDYEIAAFKNTA